MGGGISKVVEEWKSEDGLSWYRKWSNGFKECAIFASTQNDVFMFPIEFSNTNYFVVIAGYFGDKANDDLNTDGWVRWYWSCFGSSRKTTTSIGRGGNYAADGYVHIYAFGY